MRNSGIIRPVSLSFYIGDFIPARSPPPPAPFCHFLPSKHGHKRCRPDSFYLRGISPSIFRTPEHHHHLGSRSTQRQDQNVLDILRFSRAREPQSVTFAEATEEPFIKQPREAQVSLTRLVTSYSFPCTPSPRSSTPPTSHQFLAQLTKISHALADVCAEFMRERGKYSKQRIIQSGNF